MNRATRRRRQVLASLAIAWALFATTLRATVADEPPAPASTPSPAAPSEPVLEPEPAPAEPAPEPEPAPAEPTPEPEPEPLPVSPTPELPATSNEEKPTGDEAAASDDRDAEQPPLVGKAKTKKADSPCRKPGSFKDAWLDKVRRGVFYSVCGSAAWFDNFFGDEHTYDPNQIYGRLSAGLLYDATGEIDERSKFDANVPLPNLSKRMTAFLGRDNPEQFISDSNEDLSAPEAFRETSDERSWLAGFGYNPPGRRGGRMSYRLGVKVSMNPYVFAQARYRFNHYTSHNTALRFHETLFYRTNDDQFGSTTYVGYDWIPRRTNLARVSAQGTISDDTEGVKWKSYATFFQDLALKSGKPRGIAYQLLANGETDHEVPLREYGFLTVYREQMFRQWFFGEITLGYSWVRETLDEKREGGVTVGFVFEILFGDYYDRR